MHKLNQLWQWALNYLIPLFIFVIFSSDTHLQALLVVSKKIHQDVVEGQNWD